MLVNIKSDYFIRIILSYLDVLSKLRIIKYNKALQNKIDINISDYERNSKTYIIFKENNIVEEYDSVNDELIFEGEYLNRKRNGKGKEYDDYGKLIFDGEYLNGKRNGKGKEYDIYGNLIFEGEYLNGKKWNGKGYDEGKIIYELKDGKGFIQDNIRINSYRYVILLGEYINGEANGKMKEHVCDSLIFDGEYLNGKRNGKGKEFKNNILIFEGEYLNGKKWNGKQSIQNYGKDEIYEIKNGKGFLVEFDQARDYYEGEFFNGERNGKGKEYFNGNRIKFDGEYLNGKRNGKGKEY